MRQRVSAQPINPQLPIPAESSSGGASAYFDPERSRPNSLLRFSDQECSAWQDFSGVTAAMWDEGIEALIAMDPHTVAIITNYCNALFLEFGFKETPTCILILASGETVAVMPRNQHQREHAPWIDEFTGRYTDSCYYDQGLMVEALARTLNEKGLGRGRIGFEMGFIPVASWTGSGMSSPACKRWMGSGSGVSVTSRRSAPG